MELDASYREWAPPPRLRSAVACFWTRTVQDDARVLVLPDACSDLIWQVERGAFVAGPDTGPVATTHPVGALLLGVRFLPGAGGPALQTPLSELRNQRIDLVDVLPKLARSLGDSLSPEEALAHLVEVTTELVKAGPPDPIVQDVGRRLGDPRVRVAELADELAVSERHLRRLCHQAVGYGPKTLHRVLRFRRFLASATASPSPPDLAGLAFSSGYADQAHLTRECGELAGMTPAQLLRSA